MANLKRNQLSILKVKHAKPGVYTDGGGLILRVRPSRDDAAGYSASRLTGKVRQAPGSAGIPRSVSKTRATSLRSCAPLPGADRTRPTT